MMYAFVGDETIAGCFSLIVAMTLAVSGCNGGNAGSSSCSSDVDCPGDRVCTGGSCTAPWKTGGDAASSPTDGNADEDASRRPSEDTTASDTHQSVDASVPDSTVADDAVIWPEDGGDAGPTGPLSCNEFFKCSNFLCDQYDYQCRGTFNDRMPKTEKQQRKQFTSCSREKCAGKRGSDYTKCLYDQCGAIWKKCYTDPDGTQKLNCSEFRACVNACYIADDPTSCRADCQKRATKQAPKRLRAYTDCYSKNCQGKRGSAAQECVQKYCQQPFRACYGC